VVAAYRQVADAEEERIRLINEAEAYYARTLLSAAGEPAIRLLSESVNQPDADGLSEDRGVSGAGEVSDWKLNPDLWAELIGRRADNAMILSGEAASKLHRAQEDRERRVRKAEGSVARFTELVDVSHTTPELTSSMLYFSAVSEVLAGRPLTVVDPKVTGRQHLLMLDPDDFAAPSFLQPILDPDEPLTGGNESVGESTNR
jgi:regulator of protease activity HflC (stomatin/prohibitin superfamily)